METLQNPILKNVESGQIVELIKSPFSIGRALTADFVIENKIVSRTHCILTKTNEGWTLTDSSTNGTLVNEGHFKGETSPILKHNDEISLGFRSFSYKFLTKIEKVPNLQVERLKNDETLGNTTTSNEVLSSSPSTPNSFDEFGISDELLNNLADDMLNDVEEHKTNAESQEKANITSLNSNNNNQNVLGTFQINSEQPTTSAFNFPQTFGHQLEQDTESSAHSASNNQISYHSDVERNIVANTVNSSDILDGKPGQFEIGNNVKNQKEGDVDGRIQSETNSSTSTIIYSLPEDLPKPSIYNTEVQICNTNVEQTSVGNIEVNTGPSGQNIFVDSREIAQKYSERNTNPSSANVNIQSTGMGLNAFRDNRSTNDQNLRVKPENHFSEVIETVVKKYSVDATTNSSFANVDSSLQSTSTNSSSANASTLLQGTGTALNTFNVNQSSSRAPLVPTSVALASPLNSNKKIRVMSTSPGIINQLRPATGQVLYTIGPDQKTQRASVVRSLTNREMQILLENIPTMPIITVANIPTGLPGPSTSGTNSTGAQGISTRGRRVYKNNRGRTAASSTINTNMNSSIAQISGNPASSITTFAASSGGIFENSSLNTNGSTVLNNALLQNVNSSNLNSSIAQISGNPSPNITPFAASSGCILENSSLNSRSSVSDYALLQNASSSNLNSSIAQISGNPTPSITSFAASSGGILENSSLNTRSSVSDCALLQNVGSSSIEVTGGTAVPAAVNEVVIETTGYMNPSISSTSRNQAIPAMKCHDSEEPSTSRLPEKVEIDNSKSTNQNQFEEMENELMCTICANLFIKAVTLGCSHSFCQYCIEQWKKKKSDCPICRNKMTSTTRTLVLDNIIEKMLENASEEDKQARKAAVDERKQIEDAKITEDNKRNASRNTRGTNRARRGGRGNTRGNQRNNAASNNAAPNNLPEPIQAPPLITIVDSASSTDSFDDSDEGEFHYDDYYEDAWYNGVGGAYYGGYGRCYLCGERGHWANGCPYR